MIIKFIFENVTYPVECSFRKTPHGDYLTSKSKYQLLSTIGEKLSQRYTNGLTMTEQDFLFRYLTIKKLQDELDGEINDLTEIIYDMDHE